MIKAPTLIKPSQTFYLPRTWLGKTSSRLFDSIITQAVTDPRAALLNIKHSVEFKDKYFGRVVKYLVNL